MFRLEAHHRNEFLHLAALWKVGQLQYWHKNYFKLNGLKISSGPKFSIARGKTLTSISVPNKADECCAGCVGELNS